MCRWCAQQLVRRNCLKCKVAAVRLRLRTRDRLWTSSPGTAPSSSPPKREKKKKENGHRRRRGTHSRRRSGATDHIGVHCTASPWPLPKQTHIRRRTSPCQTPPRRAPLGPRAASVPNRTWRRSRTAPSPRTRPSTNSSERRCVFFLVSDAPTLTFLFF